MLSRPDKTKTAELIESRKIRSSERLKRILNDPKIMESIKRDQRSKSKTDETHNRGRQRVA